MTEKLIHNIIQEFSDENKILCTHQSGFLKHLSTDTCLSYLTDKVRKGFEKGLSTGTILIDFQKSLDTIDHDILLQDMNFPGFSESAIMWFRSFLAKTYFTVNEQWSSPALVS